MHFNKDITIGTSKTKQNSRRNIIRGKKRTRRRKGTFLERYDNKQVHPKQEKEKKREEKKHKRERYYNKQVQPKQEKEKGKNIKKRRKEA